MTQQKQPTFSKKISKILVTVSTLVLAAVTTITGGGAAYATTDCSDVFTPLSTYVTDGVAANKDFYVRAMNETGVPWELLAAIHYRESNFSHTNPSNGQGIFQFANGEGGPYPPGPVSDDEFYRQLKYMANQIQTDYVFRGITNPEHRALVPSEQDMNLVKDTLFSYNGRSTAYANQAATYGYDPTTQPYEGSPYVMNRFDCPRARMGIITQDYGVIDSTDTRYGAFTIFARLRGDNFWLLMTQPYSWELYSQEAYLDSKRTLPANTTIIAPNQPIYFRVRARNLGSSTWTNNGSNPILLATTNPTDRLSPFCTASWINCNRPALLLESSVTPGNIGTFEFTASASSLGSYKEYYNLVAEGKSWFNDFGLNWPITIIPPVALWQQTDQQVYADSAHQQPINVGAMAPDTTYYAVIKARNTGNTTWSNTEPNPTLMGTSNPTDRTSQFYDSSWVNQQRPAILKESSVAPGETGTFEFAIHTPSSYGTYNEYFRPVVEGSMWMNDIGLYWPFTVAPPTSLWSLVSQQAYTDATESTPVDTGSITNGQRIYITIKALNTGNTTWSNTGPNPVDLGTTGPNDRSSEFYDSSWLSPNRPARLSEASVPPGSVGTFNFWVTSPYKINGTTMKEYFRPVAEGLTWMNDIGMYQPFTFNTPINAWSYVSQGAYSDQAMTTPADLSNAARNTTYYLSLKAKNTSGATWQQSNLSLGTSNPSDRTSSFYNSSWLSTNRPTRLAEQSVAPGAVGTFNFTITTPNSAITSQEYFRPVIEGQTWLVDLSLYWYIGVQ